VVGDAIDVGVGGLGGDIDDPRSVRSSEPNAPAEVVLARPEPTLTRDPFLFVPDFLAPAVALIKFVSLMTGAG
jgi:hypothetical protein